MKYLPSDWTIVADGSDINASHPSGKTFSGTREAFNQMIKTTNTGYTGEQAAERKRLMDMGILGAEVNPLTGGIEKLLAAGVDLAAVTPAEKSALMVHPRYHCHISAASAFPDSMEIPDVSGNERHGTAGAALSTNILNASAGYFSTGVADNQMISIPDFNFDWGAGEKLFMWCLHKNAPHATSIKVPFSNTLTGGPGLKISAFSAADANYPGGISVGLANQSGSQASGVSSIRNAQNGTLMSFGIWLDGSAKTFSGWANEVIDRNQISWVLSGSTATSTNMLVGGTPASITPQIATALRALVIIKFSANDPTPTIAQLTAAQMRLRKNPGKLLSKADLWTS